MMKLALLSMIITGCSYTQEHPAFFEQIDILNIFDGLSEEEFNLISKRQRDLYDNSPSLFPEGLQF